MITTERLYNETIILLNNRFIVWWSYSNSVSRLGKVKSVNHYMFGPVEYVSLAIQTSSSNNL